MSDGFSIGTQHSLVITDDVTGASVPLDGRRTAFSSKPREKLETSEPVDQGGLVEDVLIPGGWSGSIKVDRNSDDFGALYALLEEAFYGGAAGRKFTITSYEPTPDKSAIAVYQFTKVVFHNYDPGEWSRGMVKPSVDFVAQKRTKIS